MDSLDSLHKIVAEQRAPLLTSMYASAVLADVADDYSSTLRFTIGETDYVAYVRPDGVKLREEGAQTTVLDGSHADFLKWLQQDHGTD